MSPAAPAPTPGPGSAARPHRRRATALVGAVVLAGVATAACGGSSDDAGPAGPSAVTVSDAWARDAGDTGAVYMSIEGGSEDDAVVSVEVAPDVAAEARLHETLVGGGDARSGGTDDAAGLAAGDGPGDGGSGMMSMQQLDQIAIPAHDTVLLAPGGFHVMMPALLRDLRVGETFGVRLTLGSGRTVETAAVVKEA